MSTTPAFDDVSVCSTCMPKLTTYGHIIGVYYYFSTKLTNFDALKGQNQIFTCPEESVKFWQVWLHFEGTFFNEEAN